MHNQKNAIFSLESKDIKLLYQDAKKIIDTSGDKFDQEVINRVLFAFSTYLKREFKGSFFRAKSSQEEFDHDLYYLLTGSTLLEEKEFRKIISDPKVKKTQHPGNMVELAKLAQSKDPLISLNSTEISKLYEDAKRLISIDSSKYSEEIINRVKSAVEEFSVRQQKPDVM